MTFDTSHREQALLATIVELREALLSALPKGEYKKHEDLLLRANGVMQTPMSLVACAVDAGATPAQLRVAAEWVEKQRA